MVDRKDELEGAHLSNWLADYSQDLMEDGGHDQEAAELNRAAQWIADHLNPAQSQPPADAIKVIRADIARSVTVRKALQAMADFMRKDVQSGDSDLWTPEYEAMHDDVIIALHDLAALASLPAPDVASQRGLAEGCCSASSPCSHQKMSPYTLCDMCQRASALRAVTIVIPSGYRDAAEFLKDCQFEESLPAVTQIPSGDGK